MRNFLLLSVAAISIGLTDPASAQHRQHHGGGYHGGHHGRGHYSGGRPHGGGNWIAPLVGGMVLGGIIGGLVSRPDYGYNAPPVYTEQRYYPVCRNHVVGQDYYGRPVVERICQ